MISQGQVRVLAGHIEVTTGVEDNVEGMAQARISGRIALHKDITKGMLPAPIASTVEAKDFAEILECVRDVQIPVRTEAVTA